jgi:hypothetical protein
MIVPLAEILDDRRVVLAYAMQDAKKHAVE